MKRTNHDVGSNTDAVLLPNSQTGLHRDLRLADEWWRALSAHERVALWTDGRVDPIVYNLGFGAAMSGGVVTDEPSDAARCTNHPQMCNDLSCVPCAREVEESKNAGSQP